MQCPPPFLTPEAVGGPPPGSLTPLLHPSDLPAPTCKGFSSISPTAYKCIVLRGYTHTHTSSLIYIDEYAVAAEAAVWNYCAAVAL